MVNVRLARPGEHLDAESDSSYRHALVVNEYEIVEVVQGAYAERAIYIAQWAIRDGRVLAGARRSAGEGFTLTVERYDAHGSSKASGSSPAARHRNRRWNYDVGRPMRGEVHSPISLWSSARIFFSSASSVARPLYYAVPAARPALTLTLVSFIFDGWATCCSRSASVLECLSTSLRVS